MLLFFDIQKFNLLCIRMKVYMLYARRYALNVRTCECMGKEIFLVSWFEWIGQSQNWKFPAPLIRTFSVVYTPLKESWVGLPLEFNSLPNLRNFCSGIKMSEKNKKISSQFPQIWHGRNHVTWPEQKWLSLSRKRKLLKISFQLSEIERGEV